MRLWLVLKPRLAAKAVTTVYETLERPLVAGAGARWSGPASGSTARRWRSCRATSPRASPRLEDEISELAGEEFNIGSPKQLGDILFGKMGLPGGRKTKTGAWSTDADALEELAAKATSCRARCSTGGSSPS